MALVYVGAGSNEGDRAWNLDQARERLAASGIIALRSSPYYPNPALLKLGQPSQPDFLNAVFELETDLSPRALLGVLESIERACGRVSKGDWSARTLDLDLLFYGDRRIEEPGLRVPHPELEKRSFVLKPLADLAPDMVHPVLKKTIRALLQDLKP